MTDEKVKEEFNRWSVSKSTDEEVAFYESEPEFKSDLLIGFYAGFRTAERLAKIEVLEEMKKELDEAGNDCFYSCENLEYRINELKAGR